MNSLHTYNEIDTWEETTLNLNLDNTWHIFVLLIS